MLDLEDSASDSILRAELGKKRRYKDADGVKEAPTAELLTRAQVQTALNGNALAQREVDRQRRELERQDRERARLAEREQAEQFGRMLRYRELQAREYAAASEERAASFELGPHSDDILIDCQAKRWRVRGPIGPDDLGRYEYFRAQRNVLYLRAVIRVRTCPKSEIGRLSLNDILWVTFDASLPARWQLHPTLEEVELWYGTMSLRKLRRLLSEAERKLPWLRPLARLAEHDRDGYRLANMVLKPLLKPYGFRSLAQFESAYERSGGDMKLVKLA